MNGPTLEADRPRRFGEPLDRADVYRLAAEGIRRWCREHDVGSGHETHCWIPGCGRLLDRREDPMILAGRGGGSHD